MGKKSKKQNKNRGKIHIKVKREHIVEADNQLRKLYNERFEANIPSKTTDRESDQREVSGPDILESKFMEIVDFYHEAKYSKNELFNSGKGDQIKMAFNNLCDGGIRATLNHAHSCGLPPSSLKTLSIKGMYGIDPEALELSDSEEDDSEKAKLTEIVSKTNSLITETHFQKPPEGVSHASLKYF